MARQKKPFDAVQFTRESAERVARVVRQAELTPAAASPLTFDRRLSDRHPKQVRAATFTGAWAINASKVVTFRFAPTATANVLNLLINLPSAGQRNCIVGREGTAWHLVNWQWDVVNAATAASITTSTLTFNTLPVGALATAATSSFSVNATACS
jgi:hypothetical protein